MVRSCQRMRRPSLLAQWCFLLDRCLRWSFPPLPCAGKFQESKRKVTYKYLILKNGHWAKSSTLMSIAPIYADGSACASAREQRSSRRPTTFHSILRLPTRCRLPLLNFLLFTEVWNKLLKKHSLLDNFDGLEGRLASSSIAYQTLRSRSTWLPDLPQTSIRSAHRS